MKADTVKRYSPNVLTGKMREDEHGPYVMHIDYAALQLWEAKHRESESRVSVLTQALEKMHGYVETMGHAYKGFLPTKESPDVKTRVAFIEDLIRKADKTLNGEGR